MIDNYINKIICGDCIEVMQEMPEESVDLIVTSPPYNASKDYDDDLSLSDWLLAARTCDTRGTHTVTGSKTATVGDRYVLTSDGTSSGTVVCMGKVKSKGD